MTAARLAESALFALQTATAAGESELTIARIAGAAFQAIVKHGNRIPNSTRLPFSVIAYAQREPEKGGAR